MRCGGEFAGLRIDLLSVGGGNGFQSQDRHGTTQTNVTVSGWSSRLANDARISSTEAQMKERAIGEPLWLEIVLRPFNFAAAGVEHGFGIAIGRVTAG